MKTSQLIKILTESLEENGDLEVNGIVGGVAFGDVEINLPGSDSPLYIEFYEPVDGKPHIIPFFDGFASWEVEETWNTFKDKWLVFNPKGGHSLT